MDIKSNTQTNTTSPKQYKSPASKLLRFFENSRDKWKNKTKEAKYQIKLLRKKIKYLEQNKQIYKEQNNKLESELQIMKDKEKKMQEEIDHLKKKR